MRDDKKDGKAYLCNMISLGQNSQFGAMHVNIASLDALGDESGIFLSLTLMS